MKIPRSFLVLASVTLIVATAWASDWKQFHSPAYGFKMLIPAGTSVQTKEWGSGWGGLYAVSDGVRLYGIAKLGTQASDAEIEKFAVETLGVSASGWKKIDQGSGRGWTRYRTFEATKGSKLFFGGYGVGAKGTYLLYLETTAEDYAEHKSDYHEWYASVTLE